MSETLDILSDPQARAEIAGGLAAIAAGDFVDGADAVRVLRPKR